MTFDVVLMLIDVNLMSINIIYYTITILINNIFYYRIYGSAYLKGVPIKCFPIMNIQNELKKNTHETIAKLIINSKFKVPIVGVNRETGSTAWYNENLRSHQQFAFGIPRWFLRLEFTSAIADLPFAYVSWIKFTLENVTGNNCFIGHIAAEEWNEGPFIHKNDDINPFCSLDYLMPSRFLYNFLKHFIIKCVYNTFFKLKLYYF